ncbi:MULTISPECIES: hypothetical protein [Streptomyces]|uniref:Methylmalonyl Co-A mutase-associated GTPase MeaB n=2 Tax=Streptomyces TaxID=1883 RepID=A0ABV9IRL0_9ACTN
MSFIADKTRELRAALQAGDTARAAQVINEVVLENDQPFETTITQLTDLYRQQQR